MTKLSRLNQILAFTRPASTPIDFLKLLVLGYARGHSFDSSDLISVICQRLFPSLVIQPHTMHGVKINLNPSDLGHLISFQEIFLEDCYDLTLVPFTPKTVLDCGAHIGLFSLIAAHTYSTAKVIAFEPNPNNINYIYHQLKLNKLNISLLEAAVSKEDGEAWFRSECSNTGSLQVENSNSKDSYRVKTVNLQHYINHLQTSSLLLKLDIEGEENLLLPKIIPYLPKECAIFLESHNGEDGWNQIVQYLTEANFQVRQIRSRYPYVDGFASRTK